ncbi:MAG TPA: hypothetical protein PK048_00355 [Candidatus Absconditabacterales bacterium]|nr:hypothetical protein [Candidatus Absconditabacterales bacterium]
MIISHHNPVVCWRVNTVIVGKQDKSKNNNSFNSGGKNAHRSSSNSNSNGRERNRGHKNAEEHSKTNKQGGNYNDGRVNRR